MTRTIEITAFAVAVLVAALAVHAWLASRDDQLRLQSTLATQKQLIDTATARESSRDATLQQTLAQIDALKRAAQTPAEILRDLPKYISLPEPITLSAPQPTAGASAKKQRPLQLSRSIAAATQQGTDLPRGTGRANAAAGFPTDATSPSSPPASSTASSVALAYRDQTQASILPQAPALRLPVADQANPPSPEAEIPAADLKPLSDYVQDCRACQARLAAAKQDATDDASKIEALTRERDAAVTAAKGGTVWQRFRRNALWFAIGAATGVALRDATHR